MFLKSILPKPQSYKFLKFTFTLVCQIWEKSRNLHLAAREFINTHSLTVKNVKHNNEAYLVCSFNNVCIVQSLGMCTATVMFVLSQDQLNMDLDRDCLELMLNLLESDISHTSALDDCGLSDVQLLKTRQKVRELCADIQAKGHAKHLNLDNITVSEFAALSNACSMTFNSGAWLHSFYKEVLICCVI